MASKKIASLTQKAIFGKSLLTDKAFKAFQDLPDAVQKKILPKIKSGDVKGLKAIEEAAQKAQKTVGKASETSQVRKGREALEKAGKEAKPKTDAPKTKPKTEAPKDPPKIASTKTTPKNTNYNINTVKALNKSKDAVNKGGRSLGNKIAIAGGSAATAAALTAGALTSADRRQQSQLNTISGPADKKKAPKKVDKSTKDKKSKSVSSVDEMGGGKSNKDKIRKDKIGKEDPANAPTNKNTRISDSGGREDVKERNKTRKRKPLEQGKRRYKGMTIDSTDEGMSKFLGTKDEIRQQMEDEEMNFNKGGMAKYKKGGMAKAFGKGGMYKAPKKTYGMRNGGFTRRGRA